MIVNEASEKLHNELLKKAEEVLLALGLASRYRNWIAPKSGVETYPLYARFIAALMD